MKKIFLSVIAIFMIIFCAANVAISREINEMPHWQKKVVTVYVPTEDTKASSMKRAFAKWQGKSYGKLQFRFVNKGPADIDVVFTEQASGSSPISSSSVGTSGTKITKAEIRIATKDPNFKKYSNDFVYTAMLHEVGRAIGMPNNDRKKTSIMHTPVTVNQDIMKFDIMKLYSVYGWDYAHKDTSNTTSAPTSEKPLPKESAKPAPATLKTEATPENPSAEGEQKPDATEQKPDTTEQKPASDNTKPADTAKSDTPTPVENPTKPEEK